MKYSVREVAATIDHAVLKPTLTESDIRAAAKMCIAFRVASMCVRPCDIVLGSRLLKDTPVKLSCVLSFPHGDDSSASKAFLARDAIRSGVQEIDMVMNIGRFLDRHYDDVRDDIRAVVDAAHEHGVLVKVIQESCYLSPAQIADACNLSLEAGADFVKTSTGFGPASATPETVGIMVRTVGGKMGIKASGGIRSWEQAVGYLQQGATRLGIGATEAVLTGGAASGNY